MKAELDSQLSWPASVDLAVALGGKLYVVTVAGDITKLNWEDDGKFTWPANIVMDRDQDLWVSDEATHRITGMSNEAFSQSKVGQGGRPVQDVHRRLWDV